MDGGNESLLYEMISQDKDVTLKNIAKHLAYNQNLCDVMDAVKRGNNAVVAEHTVLQTGVNFRKFFNSKRHLIKLQSFAGAILQFDSKGNERTVFDQTKIVSKSACVAYTKRTSF